MTWCRSSGRPTGGAGGRALVDGVYGGTGGVQPGHAHTHDDQVDVTVDALVELLQSGGGMSQGMDLS